MSAAVIRRYFIRTSILEEHDERLPIIRMKMNLPVAAGSREAAICQRS